VDLQALGAIKNVRAVRLDVTNAQDITAAVDEVAAAVDLALFEPKPKRRYLVVPAADQAERTIRKQIEQLVQLNEGQPFTYDRNTLVKMLDEALAQSRPRTQ
jgi:hypothetical protein